MTQNLEARLQIPGTNESDRQLISRLAWFLDSAIRIPGTNMRVGLDAVIGLIPWVGDVVGTLLSLLVVGMSVKIGASRWTVLRMGFNVLVELIVGSVPVVGDLFDAVWKANERNVRLLERSVIDRRAGRKDFFFLFSLFSALFLALGLSIYGSYTLTVWIFQRVSEGFASF